MGDDAVLDYYDELYAALTKDVHAAVQRYARRRGAMLARAGIHVDDDVLLDLIDDAIGATCDHRRWVSSERSLTTHLCNLVKTATSNMLRHHNRFRHESMTRGDAASERVTEEVIEVEPARSPEQLAATRDAARRVFGALDQMAADAEDETVGSILAAFEEGLWGRAEIAEQLSISVTEYKAALLRLRRMVAKLPEELRAGALEAMRGTP